MPRARVAANSCWALVTLWLALGCSYEPTSTKGLRRQGVNHGQAPASPVAPVPERPAPPPHEPPPIAEALPAVAPEPEAQPQPDKPPRDMPKELLSKLGSPQSCLVPRAADQAPSSVQIGFSASVMPSGAIGRAEVSGAGLSDGERECLRRRLSGLRFETPIEDAPKNVSATITLAQAPAKPN